ncbi:M20/M25/M40 family metallo-hydrolase [Agreia sp. COWG]|uniref:M20/M25/M40 family metallo-hydrolase n=1 Tax=Agreia sp. COWG TaxID=2773266 RepID=UPI0019255985|nr:M20/M25/M40 family metallo-hydrolase [Agreia sp. COWG]CAD5990900.1 Acetylornithine deacetylase [Agreia sp. COWG]
MSHIVDRPWQRIDDSGDTELIALLRRLVEIDSSNPDLGRTGSGESAIADFVTRWLEPRGCVVTRLEATPGRPSIVATWPGTGGGRSIMLNGHLDTVSLDSYGPDALVAVVRDGSLFGRGSYDMKSGLSAMMAAAASAAETPHRGDIVLALVADEEFESAGTIEVLRHVKTDGAIVVEPSDGEVTLAHRGLVWLDVTIEGRAAHGSRPDLGRDAIVQAGRFLSRLGDLAIDLAARPGHPILGPANVHASLVRGGVEMSSYPAECTVGVEWRTVPGQDVDTVVAEIESLLAAVSAEHPGFSHRITPGLTEPPFEADRSSAVVRTVLASVESVTGAPPVLRGEPFWTDCALLAEAGIPAVLYGVTGGGAHAASEWVELDSVDTVARVLERTIIDFCA